MSEVMNHHRCRSVARELEQTRDHVSPLSRADYSQLRIVALPRNESALAFYEFGDPTGRPVLCLHGLSTSGLFFGSWDDFFDNRGVRAIAPCLVGGIYEQGARKTPAQLAAEVVELFDVLGFDRFAVMGCSWGTLIELSVLQQAPERISSAGFMGPMLPLEFVSDAEIARLKSDVRLSLRMARSAPAIHRWLMKVVCQLPISVLMDQFKDTRISEAERASLAAGHTFRKNLARSMEECRRTGSAFFTQGWRMFHDVAGYSLRDLASLARDVNVRLYIGEHDNVHLPAFAQRIASSIAGLSGRPDDIALKGSEEVHSGSSAFEQVWKQGNCSIWQVPRAGRMACLLYFQEALENLLADDLFAV